MFWKVTIVRGKHYTYCCQLSRTLQMPNKYWVWKYDLHNPARPISALKLWKNGKNVFSLILTTYRREEKTAWCDRRLEVEHPFSKLFARVDWNLEHVGYIFLINVEQKNSSTPLSLAWLDLAWLDSTWLNTAWLSLALLKCIFIVVNQW